VDDLMGPFQGTHSAGVLLEPGHVMAGGNDPCVILFTGTSAYYFQIVVRPSRARRDPPPWWLGDEGAGLEWQPGIFLATGGK
jgi:hypothetical protein